MTQPRFYCPEIMETQVTLDATETHHITHVMRLKTGDAVELFDGKGTVASAQISSIGRGNVQMTIQDRRQFSAKNTGRIILAVSVAKGRRFDDIILKCTELGVDHIFPVLFDRTVKQARGKNTLDRYQKLIVTAAKQCRRIFLPDISEPLPLEQTIKTMPQLYPDATIAFGSLDPDAIPLTQLQTENKDSATFIGPEGGLTDTELNLLRKCNAKPVRLADTVLRIETAAIAAAAILATQRNA